MSCTSRACDSNDSVAFATLPNAVVQLARGLENAILRDTMQIQSQRHPMLASPQSRAKDCDSCAEDNVSQCRK